MQMKVGPLQGSNQTTVSLGLFCNALVGIFIWAFNVYWFAPGGLPVIPAEQAALLMTVTTGAVQYFKKAG
jgi:hypothetical protein